MRWLRPHPQLEHILLMIVGVDARHPRRRAAGPSVRPNGVVAASAATFSMDPISAIILCPACIGARFSAARRPSDPLPTFRASPLGRHEFDGYPMAKAGHASRALTLAFVSPASAPFAASS